MALVLRYDKKNCKFRTFNGITSPILAHGQLTGSFEEIFRIEVSKSFRDIFFTSHERTIDTAHVVRVLREVMSDTSPRFPRIVSSILILKINQALSREARAGVITARRSWGGRERRRRRRQRQMAGARAHG